MQLTDQERASWLEEKRKWLTKEKIQTNMMKQKSRVKWTLEGDENSKYFHNYVKRRVNKNSIRGLSIDGIWSDNLTLIKEVVFFHFSNIFKNNQSNDHFSFDFDFGRVTEEDNDLLEARFKEEEIWDAIQSCGSSKAPGPDGFNMKFLKKYWWLIKKDILKVFDWFWHHMEFSRGCNASFITLVPKNNSPIGLNEYRPISLIGSMYKVVAKVLSKRLASIIHKVVGVEQSAFIKGRYIFDGVLIANEVIDELKRTKRRGILFKVDFEKAFDCLKWEFVAETMKIIDKFKKRLSDWKARSISFGGRLTLVKSVLSSLPLYFFSLFRAPGSLTKLLESLRYNFFWGGSGNIKKISWVKWEKVLLPYGSGGLNIGSLIAKNLALLGKWWWRFKTGHTSFWTKDISSIYGLGGGLDFTNSFRCPRGGSTWYNIYKAGVAIDKLVITFSSSFAKEVGNGESIKFWSDIWIGSSSLMESYSRLYALESDKQVLVKDRIVQSGENWSLNWNWIRSPRGRAIEELEVLENLLSNVRLSNSSRDKWRWSLDKEGVFTTKQLTTLIDGKRLATGSLVTETVRNAFLPQKVGIFVWRAKLKRLPVLSELDKRGTQIQSFESLFDEMLITTSSNLGNTLWQAVKWVCSYVIWKTRNNVVFKNKVWDPPKILAEVQTMSFGWISKRQKRISLEW
ncbi:uncharacterized protein [Rutidosis leptorrhynchoides]|uniref:uncharacterized protein n=1 Tax=Rutidosis leptorrhynchoides TaxID=125765 RepID=UPI003A99BF86